MKHPDDLTPEDFEYGSPRCLREEGCEDCEDAEECECGCECDCMECNPPEPEEREDYDPCDDYDFVYDCERY